MRLLTARSASQHGLSLLEVLIALSLFSVIGLASYRVLTTTISSANSSATYSAQLNKLQRTMAIIDRDLQQIVRRDIRMAEQTLPYLLINNDDQDNNGAEYPLQFSRGGYSNPLGLSRSNLIRVAYDIGLHPKSEDSNSRHYQDEQSYLRRHVWLTLDSIDVEQKYSQALLANVAEFSVTVLTDKGLKKQWPLENLKPAATSQDDEDQAQLNAIQLSWQFNDSDGNEGQRFSRFYSVL
jgi:general secretion pathway protein J